MGLQGGESMMERQRKSEVLHLCGRRRFSFEVCSRSHLLDGASSQPRSKEPQFVDNHFRRPPFLSTTVFVNHRFRRPPFSSTTIFVDHHFCKQPFSSTTVFADHRFRLQPILSTSFLSTPFSSTPILSHFSRNELHICNEDVSHLCMYVCTYVCTAYCSASLPRADPRKGQPLPSLPSLKQKHCFRF
jgi:hypothetical protein